MPPAPDSPSLIAIVAAVKSFDALVNGTEGLYKSELCGNASLALMEAVKACEADCMRLEADKLNRKTRIMNRAWALFVEGGLMNGGNTADGSEAVDAMHWCLELSMKFEQAAMEHFDAQP